MNDTLTSAASSRKLGVHGGAEIAHHIARARSERNPLKAQVMDDIKNFYGKSAIDMPKRHYLNRFVRDFRQWTEKYVDHMHYTVPLTCATADKYTFPSEYIG